VSASTTAGSTSSRPPATPEPPATAGEAAAASLARPPLAEPEPEPEPGSPDRDYPSVIDLDDPIYGLDEDDDLDAWSA